MGWGMSILNFLGLGEEEPPPSINAVFQQITRRAERLDPQQQAQTFVSLGGIENTLLNADNRVIFGRRGTGKTHVLAHVAEAARKGGNLPIMIDLRTIGSNSYLYADESQPIAYRATLLLRDLITAIHDSLLDAATAPGSVVDVRRISPFIDKLGGAIKEVVVRDTVERKSGDKDGSETVFAGEVALKASSLGGEGSSKISGSRKVSGDHSTEVVEKGHTRLSVNVGSLHRTLADIVERAGCRIWILIDEWSVIPETLQPYLADFIKRTLFTHRSYTVHIAAIEQRANFRLGAGAGSIGIELGSDAFADVNLDDHLVFENDPQRSVKFFRDLMYRHFQLMGAKSFSKIRSAEELVILAFTQDSTFREVVRACEGVPRDLINILQIAASKAQNAKISIPHIRDSAKDWYDRDKASYVNTNPEAEALLLWIIHSVIGERKAKAFLVRSDTKNEILDRLFDERIMHIARRSYSTKEEPGVRYKVWKLDYGCYVDLINTSKAPTGFLTENVDVIEDSFAVPEDDLRAIRRAVLHLDEFEASRIQALAATEASSQPLLITDKAKGEPSDLLSR